MDSSNSTGSETRKFIIEDVIIKDNERAEPCLVQFSNGVVQKPSDVKARLYRNASQKFTQRRKQRILYATTPHLSYKGKNFGKDVQNEFKEQLFLGVLDKETNRMKLVEMSHFLLHPEIESFHEDRKMDDSEDEMDKNKRKALNQNFGGRRGRIMNKKRMESEVLTDGTSDSPWLSHIPLPRIIEIFAQSVAVSLPKYNPEEKNIATPLCIAASTIPRAVNDFILQLSSAYPAWEVLDNTEEEQEKYLSTDAYVTIYSCNGALFEKHITQLLHTLAEANMKDLREIEGQMNQENHRSGVSFIAHSCSNFQNPQEQISADTKLAHLPAVITRSKGLCKSALKIIQKFLKQCKHSVVNIKTVSDFSEMMKETVEAFSAMFPEFLELLTLFEDPPCVVCNDMLSSESDLKLMEENIDICLQGICSEKNDELRTILCMYSDWLMQCRDLFTVKILFLDIL